MRQRAGALLAVTVLTATGCDGTVERASTADVTASSASPATTGTPATSAVGYVPPAPCSAAPDELAVWTAAVRIDQRGATADAVVRLAELGDRPCEIVLDTAVADASGVEPNVVLEPGGWTELVVGGSGDACADVEAVTSFEIELADGSLTVPTAAVVRCGAAAVELLAVDRPVDPCTAADLTAVTTASGFVVRNDGLRGCVVGTLDAVAFADGATMPATATWPQPELVPARSGPSVEALAPGDVVLLPTFAAPDCTAATSDASLVFSSGATVPVVAPDACTYADLGPARPWFGAPDGPLVGVDPDGAPAVWLRALDPFGDPCATVPVAPADLVDGAPILTAPTIEEDDAGRLAVWGDPATTGVRQRLDVTVDEASFADGVAAEVVPGPSRRAAVVLADPTGGGAPRIDVAERDGSCVRRYVLAPATSPEVAVATARRWVRDPS